MMSGTSPRTLQRERQPPQPQYEQLKEVQVGASAEALLPPGDGSELGAAAAWRPSNVDSLLKTIEVDPFSSTTGLWRCLMNPERAEETLSHYAELEVTVLLARDIVPREAWTEHGATPDAAVEVYLNDTKMDDFRTPTVSSRNPIWNCKSTVPIVAPDSMVRFQLVDDLIVDQKDLGFVEICVGDIPFDKQIDGMFEVRLMDNLKLTSRIRYEHHKVIREDDITTMDDDQLSVKAIQSGASRANLFDEMLKARKLTGNRSMTKATTCLHVVTHGCVSNACGPPNEQTKTQMMAENEIHRSNGGELFLRLRLRKAVNPFAACFANALKSPAPFHHGELDMSGDAPKDRPEEVVDQRDTKLQEVLDVLIEVKQVVMHDFLWCIYYYIRYIITWKFFMLTLLLTASFVAASYDVEVLAPTVFPLTVAAMLIMNGVEVWRMEMTRGGANAEFTEAGFARVARWMDTKEMYKYLERIIQDDLHGQITEPGKLRVIAAHIFRDGKPKLSFKDLRMLLRDLDDIIDDNNDQSLCKDELVLVDQRYLAKVTTPSHLVDESGDIDVEYQTARFHDSMFPRSLHYSGDPSRPYRMDTVCYSRVSRRPLCPAIAERFMPAAIRKLIVNNYPAVLKLKEQGIPAIKFVTDIVTWRKKWISLLITVCLLLAFLVGMVCAAVDFHLPNAQKDVPVIPTRSDYTLADLLKLYRTVTHSIPKVISMALIFIIVIKNAWWVTPVSSLSKIFGGCCRRRQAPDDWAFFGEDPAVMSMIQSQKLPPPVAPLSRQQLSLKDMKHRINHDVQKLQTQFQGTIKNGMRQNISQMKA